ncbi:MAG: recombinase family protein [Cyanosarcina radialis HA8281-LM2]|nr:recombinase family protein [Cyanosarcina radialis HA8281-LM2]
MVSNSIWLTGTSRSGKTTRLIDLFCQWLQEERLLATSKRSRSRQAPGILVFAANDDNKRDLADKLAEACSGRYPILAKTPLGFFQDEVMLFWPLLIQRLGLKAQFPLRLRPETEQELATRLWRDRLDSSKLQQMAANEYRAVRRILDLLQLAALSGTPTEEIPQMLDRGLESGGEEDGEMGRWGDGMRAAWDWVGELLLEWRGWCLERGLLSYGIISELYWRYLLPDATYQQHLSHRYQAVLADDVDDYPAIARDLFDLLLDRGAIGAFTFNPDGAIRLGLNADPQYLAGLKFRCQVETLTQKRFPCLAESIGETVVELATDPTFLTALPDAIPSIQTISRGQMLRQTAAVIIRAVQSGEVKPSEIVVIAPGLDAIARYTLTEILATKGIAAESLNEQRPLIASPMIRALLTLLTLVYPGLGRLVDREAIAEMLVVLSSREERGEERARECGAGGAGEGEMGRWGDGERGRRGREGDKGEFLNSTLNTPHLTLKTDIDPVRAGLLADHCYCPDLEQPRLLPVTAFPRWDRLGHRATAAYERILQWLEVQQQQQQMRLIPSCVVLLDRAIQEFLWNGSYLPYDRLAALRELMETAQHYWEVNERWRQSEQIEAPAHTTIAQFILLLRQGTVTANPYPIGRFQPAAEAVTLANIFQYRASRQFHKWQFWLDASSPLWMSGGAATLFAAPLFLKNWSGQPWTAADAQIVDEERLQRIVRDLLSRAGDRIYLCHSDLAVNGQEQTGPLLSLVNASLPLTA